MVAKYTLKSACSQTIAVRGDFVSKQSKTSERNHAVPPVARPLRDLLEIAGALPSDKKAMAWLAKALAGTPSILGAAKQRPLRVDHNDLLADIEKSAKELTRRIQRLRWHPRTRQAFWRSGVFGPVYNNRVEISAVVSTLEDIVSAADSARDRRGKGRPRAVGKQQVIDLAFAFFVRFSPHRPSGTPYGPVRHVCTRILRSRDRQRSGEGRRP